MSTRDPVDRSLLRMEIRRFQTRCEAQEGTIQRADSLRQVARLAVIPIPFPLTEDTTAMDARRAVRQAAEEKARELVIELIDRLAKAEPFAREKIRRLINEEFLQLTGALSTLRPWAYAKLDGIDQSLPDQP